ncbi:Gfo/Idh/MocA family oxidoreductase [Thalassobius sp. I31.1]|uniref:Gfo/Idh/MocA family protein n=1 Tax=Thalassobius sp. I31.1 TaxID=2109912 RepID=UPI000D19F3A5|nr:Gfo/Idh/MocA family oxidoreductase [Thalassobius sp. I31.1]
MSNIGQVLLVGAGGMAQAYAAVLTSMGVTPRVLGRSPASAAAFEAATGLTPGTGDLVTQLEGVDPNATAIVTVNAHALAEVTQTLMRHGIKRLMVEKPAALDMEEMASLQSVATAVGAEVYVAYNRRFLSSVIEADRLIDLDGGIVSVKFDFSEPTRKIGALGKPERELSTWFYGNSTHVIDLAFHFFGPPDTLEAHVAAQGGIDWHPQAGVFTGFGASEDGATIAWHSNWVSPGRWGLEVLTRERRIIMQPLEKLRIQTHDSFAEIDHVIEDACDQSSKPGLLRQTTAFLTGADEQRLVSLEAHGANMVFYEAIRNGTSYTKAKT